MAGFGGRDLGSGVFKRDTGSTSSSDLNIRTLDILGGVSGGLKALSEFHLGAAKAAELGVQAEFEDLNAEAEFTNALNAASAIREGTNRLQAAGRAGYAANGFDVGGQGTVGRFQDEVSARSEFAIGTVLLTGDIRRQTRRLNAVNLRIAAKNARRAGIINAIFSIFGTATSILTRGGTG